MWQPLFQNTFLLRKPRAANFADIIKNATMFIETIFKTQKKFKKLEIKYQNAIYVSIS